MISVIVPIYNTEKYLKRALNSLLKQTYQDLEILLIDDGSTDSSLKICQEYAKKDYRIKVFHQENKGVSVVRNFGLSVAKGEYISFLDSDDYMEPNMLQTLYQNLIDTESDISVCHYQKFKDQISHIQVKKIVKVLEPLQALEDIISDGLLTNFLWNKLFKKSVFCSFAFPVNKIYEDVYIMPKLLEQAKKICYTNLILYYYYQREDSYVNYYSKEKNDNYLEVCHEVYRQLLKYEILNDKLKAYRIFYIYSAFLQLAKSNLYHVMFDKNMNQEYIYFRKNIKYLQRNFSLKRKLLIYALYMHRILFYQIVKIMK